MKANRFFYMSDINSTVTVEYMTRKEIMSWLDSYLDTVELANSGCAYANVADECFEILYKDGTTDYINEEYDGHKIRRQNIAAIVYSNPSSYCVYGHFSMNECGCACAAFEDEISEELKEVDSADYTE